MKLIYFFSALGAAPFGAALLARATIPASVPDIQPVKVKTETIRQIPLTKSSPFAERWNLPPIRMVKVLAPEEPIPVPQPRAEPQPTETKHKVIYHYRDVCAKHGMRKVQYGKRWRCRR